MVAPIASPLDYPIYVERGARSHLGTVVTRVATAHRYAIIADATVWTLHGAQCMATFPAAVTRVFVVPPGEQEKTRERWSTLTDELLAWGAGRDTTIVAVGGGVIGDLAGFVAATYLRGVSFVQVPTTLLAMVDASVGGKTGVDAAAGKNLVGAFHNPRAVVIDPDVLLTLPDDVFRSGLAEMIKHGVVAEASYFAAMHDQSDALRCDGAHADHLPTLIADSVRIKASIVAHDAHEHGQRRILNFGHTLAHAIEREMHYRMLHGDAVAIGMVLEARLAERLGVAAQGLSAAIDDALQRVGLPTRLPEALSVDAVLDATRGDKKSLGGSVRYALPRSIGAMEAANGLWSVEVPGEVVREILRDSSRSGQTNSTVTH